MTSRAFSSRTDPAPGTEPAGVLACSVECPSCGQQNPTDARFCTDCGLPVDLVACPHCGAVNRRDAAFCYQCQASTSGRTSADRDPQPIATPARESSSAAVGEVRVGPEPGDPQSVSVAPRSDAPEPLDSAAERDDSQPVTVRPAPRDAEPVTTGTEHTTSETPPA